MSMSLNWAVGRAGVKLPGLRRLPREHAETTESYAGRSPAIWTRCIIRRLAGSKLSRR